MSDTKHRQFPARGKTTIFFVLLTFGIIFALALSNILTGMATISSFLASFRLIQLIYLLVSGLLAAALLVFAIKKILKTEDPKIMLFIRYGILVWSPLHALGFSLLFHSVSSYGNYLDAQVIIGMYAASVGLFFGILMDVAMFSDLEQLLPENQHLENKIVGGLTSKLALSVTGVVSAFLIGAIGITLMAALAGIEPLAAIPRLAGIAIPFLLATLILVFFLSRILTLPLVASMPKIQALGQNDLTQELRVTSRDELGRLFITLNGFLKSLRSVLREAVRNSDTNRKETAEVDTMVAEEKALLANIANEMREINTILVSLDENTQKTVDATNSMNTLSLRLQESVDSQSESVESTSTAAEQMLASVQSIAQVTQTRKDAAASLHTVTSKSQEDLQTAIKSMDSVNTQINSLAELNKVISSVAAQTNLLAMNAAIEAAHAGSAGAGFSVVAQEIRKLAESTTLNSKSSSSFLKEMIASIHDSNKGLETVNLSFKQVEAVGDEVLSGLDEIASATREMEDTSKVIVSRMENLRDQNRLVSDGANSIRSELAEVNATSRQSSERSAGARVESDKILQHVHSLTELASQIGERSAALKTSAEKLSGRFETFKL
ncbi:hypothetical protein MASR2M78_20270 [Treponema sp.]